jgi:hypothetical protein
MSSSERDDVKKGGKAGVGWEMSLYEPFLRTVGTASSGIAQQQLSLDLLGLTQVFTLARLDFILTPYVALSALERNGVNLRDFQEIVVGKEWKWNKLMIEALRW